MFFCVWLHEKWNLLHQKTSISPKYTNFALENLTVVFVSPDDGQMRIK
jgi:hypothetical protein